MNLLFFLLRSSRRTVALSLAAGALSGASGVALIGLIHAEVGRETPSTHPIAWAFAGLCLVAVLTRVVAQAAMVRLGQGSVTKLCLHLCRRILGLPLAEFE